MSKFEIKNEKKIIPLIKCFWGGGGSKTLQNGLELKSTPPVLNLK